MMIWTGLCLIVLVALIILVGPRWWREYYKEGMEKKK